MKERTKNEIMLSLEDHGIEYPDIFYVIRSIERIIDKYEWFKWI